MDSRHLSRFDPTYYAAESLLYCSEYKKQKRLNEDKLRPKSIILILKPRVWLYKDFNYLDSNAIDKVRIANFKKPDAIIVVGTALRINSIKSFARNICRAVR